MFLGPAPRQLFQRLLSGAPKTDRDWGNVLPVWAKLTKTINEAYEVSFDFYTFQALPCFWIGFMALCIKFAGGEEICIKETPFRQLGVTVWRLETLRLNDLFHELGGLVRIYRQLPAEEKKRLLALPL